jgi:hypothetical protein
MTANASQPGHSNGVPENAELDTDSLAKVMIALGCPADKASEMAAQMTKRARQLAAQKQTSFEAALTHLLELMKQGWAAKERGL